MVRLVKVIKNSGGTKTTVYEGDDGNTYTLKGDLAVRANNPGNISPSAGNRQFWIDNFGAIGFVPSSPGEPHVAIFPDAESGRAAQRYLWGTGGYQNLTIEQAAKRWATDAYPDALAGAAGVPKGTLVKDLTPAQMDAMFAAQAAAEGAPNLTVLDAAGNKIDPAIILGGHPVPPGLIPNSPTDILQSLKDRVAVAQGYGEIAPTPRGRPAYFNETGKPPIPAVRGDVLTDLKDRASRIVGLEATPRLVMSGQEPVGRLDPASVTGLPPEATDVYAAGLGSLLTDPMSPAMPNPQRQLLAEQLGVRQLDAPPIPARPPTMEQLAAIRDVSRVAPVPAPSGIDARPQDLSLRAAPTPASGPAAGRPGGATEVPGFGGGKVDNSRLPTLAVAEPTEARTAVLPNGKSVQLGRSYVVGDRLLIAEAGPDGKAVLRDVEDVRDDFLRTIDPNAPLLFEKSLAGDAARMFAAPMIKEQMGQAGNALKDAAGGMLGDVSQLVGSIASQAKNTIGSMFEPKTLAATPPRDPVGGGATFDQVQRMSRTSAPLAAPGQGLTSAQRAAMAAYTPQAKPTVVAPVAAPTTKTVANPAYAEWERKYGDGSQVQTAATGGMITKNQLAAIQAVPSNSVQPTVPKPLPRPPAPPKTIKVTVTPPKTAPTPLPRPVVTAPTVYESGGYLYEPNPGGGYTKVGKAGSKTTAPVVAPKKSSSSTTSSGQAKTASDGTSWAANW